ncbi:hypothetical protein C2G38_2192868 [Gigaspora rosea]|uniref:Uncharacterized protein n=1 Tax=Gigaspora rosea TaxID=44941 RepID=A0A397UYC3_9GLOM|nr:hypothetical protein C2G38_2192868 [Gigaspora rosea]
MQIITIVKIIPKSEKWFLTFQFLSLFIFIKNNRLCLQGLAKYKITKELSQTIKFKYFSTDQPPQIFANGDIIFISGKYIVENSEPCFTVAYSSIVDSGNPNREFDTSDLSITIPHCLYFVVVNRLLKKVENLIHFGIKTVEYNSVMVENYHSDEMLSDIEANDKKPTGSINIKSLQEIEEQEEIQPKKKEKNEEQEEIQPKKKK